MKAYVSSGDQITLTSAGALLGGTGLLVGAMFGVVAETVMASGEKYVLKRSGEYDLRNAGSYTATPGAKAYWDAGAGRVTSTSTDNTFIGYFTQDVGASDVLARVVLAPAGS